MATLPFVPGVAKITIHARYGADGNVVNGFFARFSGAATETDLASWAKAVGDAWVTNIAPVVTVDYHIDDVVITDLTDATSASGSSAGTGGAGWPGGGAPGTGTPAQVAGVVRHLIARRYRGGRPRSYVAGILTSELQNEDTWVPSFVTSFSTSFNAWMTAITQGSHGNVQPTQMVNVGYVQGHTWEQDQHGNWHRMPVYKASPWIDSVSGYALNPKLGTQRRRVQ